MSGLAAWPGTVFHLGGGSAAWNLVPHFRVLPVFVGIPRTGLSGSTLGFLLHEGHGLLVCSIPRAGCNMAAS